MGQITDNLKEYFKTHTKEEVLKDWENTLEYEYNSITVDKFLTESKKLNEPTLEPDTSEANLTIPDVSKQRELLIADAEKQLLKLIQGNGLGISRFIQWLKSNL